jgi:Mlc titration factor MtfA (ptsG expression regulator)
MSDAALRVVSTVVIALALALVPALRWGAGAGSVVFAAALAVGLAANAATWRRERRADGPFPRSFRAILEREVDAYRALGPSERARFEHDVARFLAEQTITGPRGAPLDDELRVLVAASAVIVVFGRPGFRYPRTRDVVVYDDAFDDAYEVGQNKDLLGMVHGSGPILLSARALREGFRAPHDGRNVGLHEFAHVLDFYAGHAEGVPAIMPWRAVRPWLHVMHEETRRIEQHASILRDYAATNQAEFFAVATEMFFEQPTLMRDKHPALYALLSETYGQDPAHPRGIRASDAAPTPAHGAAR